MRLLWIGLLALCISFKPVAGWAAVSEPSSIEQAQVQLITGGYDAQGKIYVGLQFAIAPGWKIYWRDPGDSGFPPQLSWQGSENIADSKILWPAPKRVVERFEGITTESYVYQDAVVFPILLTPENKTRPIQAKVQVNYGVCKDICIPAQSNLVLTITPQQKGEPEGKLVEQYLARVPQADGTYGLHIEQVNVGADPVSSRPVLEVIATSQQPFATDTDVLVEAAGAAAFYQPTTEFSNNNTQARFLLPITFLTGEASLAEQMLTITLVSGMQSVERRVEGKSLGAVIGPIVLAPGSTDPVPTVDTSQPSAEQVQGGTRPSVLLMLLFGLMGGLILNVMPCVLPVLSIKLLGVIRQGGADRQQIASNFMVSAFGIILSFLALAMLIIVLRDAGMRVGWGFHFQEPAFIIALVIILTFFAANLWGLFEIHLHGSLANIAQSQSGRSGKLGHFFSGVFATVLATPCTAPFLGTAVGFALSEGPMSILPVFLAMGTGMALPYLLVAWRPEIVSWLPKPGAWMVTVKHVMGILLAAAAIWLIWVLSNQIGVVAGAILALLCIAKLVKLWLSQHIELLARKSVRYSSLLVITLLAFILPLHVSEQQHQVGDREGIWKPFDQAEIAPLVEEGQVVFVDVTADWCLTCKANKLLVLNTKEVTDVLSRMDVIAMQADWTSKDEAIESYLNRYHRVGIPFNIVYGPRHPEGIVLSELLTKKAVLDAISEARAK